ncbi:hypothetical protein [Streptomyces yangpuensis]|uniref:hypothetical protein n=1 Tax=Streptomyces yangpuensis TaxID=1648182 RepID=UPI00062933DF|nr:hypothetical protein [Streptomyces yangpuensis]
MTATQDRTGRSRATPRPFALWREVLTAYAAPALTAGAVSPRLERLRIYLPVSAALAATIVTLRWRSTLATPRR